MDVKGACANHLRGRGHYVREGNLTIDEVLNAVAEHYGLTREQLLLMERKRVLYRARHIARYLLVM